MARVCREAGARVRTNVMVRDLNVTNVRLLDARRIEVIADGLPVNGGAQIAIDTTFVSPLACTGLPRLRRAHGLVILSIWGSARISARTYMEFLDLGLECQLR